MSSIEPELSARMAEIGRKGGQARRVAAVERRIRELVDSSPPLTDEQRGRLALLLRPTAGTAA